MSTHGNLLPTRQPTDWTCCPGKYVSGSSVHLSSKPRHQPLKNVYMGICLDKEECLDKWVVKCLDKWVVKCLHKRVDKRLDEWVYKNTYIIYIYYMHGFYTWVGKRLDKWADTCVDKWYINISINLLVNVSVNGRQMFKWIGKKMFT